MTRRSRHRTNAVALLRDRPVECQTYRALRAIASSTSGTSPSLDSLYPLLRPPLPWRHALMAVHADLSVGGFLFLRRISFAVPPEGPGPTGGPHQRLQVVVAGVALRNRTIVSSVVVNLLAGDGPASEIGRA